MADIPGGPAFPVIAQRFGPTTDDIEVLTMARMGMSLRDYFAGQALAGACAMNFLATAMSEDEAALEFQNVAAFAYRCADAMLKARQ